MTSLGPQAPTMRDSRINEVVLPHLDAAYNFSATSRGITG